jgi:hypothetical protein
VDLNPREAVVDQEPSHTSEQEEEPTHSLIVTLIVPEHAVEAAKDSLKRLAPVWPGWRQAVVARTHCYTTNKGKDYCCGDLA